MLPGVSPFSEKDPGMADHTMRWAAVTLGFSWFISALALQIFWTDNGTLLKPKALFIGWVVPLCAFCLVWLGSVPGKRQWESYLERTGRLPPPTSLEQDMMLC
jgi:hypothetical protein